MKTTKKQTSYAGMIDAANTLRRTVRGKKTTNLQTANNINSYVLNIGFDNSIYSDIIIRQQVQTKIIEYLQPYCSVRDRIYWNPGQWNGNVEATAIVAITCKSENLNKTISGLAKYFNQECVAVQNQTTGQGYLIPAQKTIKFDQKYFQIFSVTNI